MKLPTRDWLRLQLALRLAYPESEPMDAWNAMTDKERQAFAKQVRVKV